MVASLIPLSAAVVAALLLKLWPWYGEESIPVLLTKLMNRAWVSGLPSLNWKKGPGLGPRIVM